MKEPTTVIRQPQLSEKTQRLQKVADTYVFIVDRAATKSDIKTAVEKLYGKKVAGVRTAVFKGKRKKEKNMLTMGVRKDWKKAYVKLRAGERLDII